MICFHIFLCFAQTSRKVYDFHVDFSVANWTINALPALEFKLRQNAALRFHPAEGIVGSAARTSDMSLTTFLRLGWLMEDS